MTAIVAVAGYGAAMAAWLGALDTSTGGRSDLDSALVFAALGLLHFVVGVAVARLWPVVLPFLVVIAAVPLGYGDPATDVPIWFVMLVLAPLGALMVALGALVGVLRGRRRTEVRENHRRRVS